MAAITLTGRPCHRATIGIDQAAGGPCDGHCVCGDRWHHDPTAATVMDWYWQHPAPPPTPRAG